MTAPKLARKAREGEPGYSPNPSDCGRVYEHPVTHAVAPSITAIIGMLDKPALKFWYRNQVAEYAADMIVKYAEYEPVPVNRAGMVKELKSAPFDNSAAKTGDVIHDAIDQFIKTGCMPPVHEWNITEQRMWSSFMRFNETYKPNWVDSEFTVWSDKHNYAGTGDWIARIGKWTVLGDWKTGNQTYPEVGLQLAALANADVILNVDGSESPIPEIHRWAVAHIRPTFAVLKPVNPAGCFETFTRLREIKRWKDEQAPTVIGDAPRISNPIRKVA